jgi:hypothetical protein
MILLILDALVCALSLYVAYNSQIHIVTVLWGFSSGIWFMLALKKAFELYYDLHNDQLRDQLPPNHLPKI